MQIANTVKKKGGPPYFYGCSNTILGACLPLHISSATTIWPGWKNQLNLNVCGVWCFDLGKLLQVYPAFGPGKDFSMDWMLLIVGRNLIATWIICGFWDWFLYFSPLQVNHQLGSNFLKTGQNMILCAQLNQQPFIDFLWTKHISQLLLFVYRCKCYVNVNVNYYLNMNQLTVELQAKLAKYKMNPQYPSFNQIKHDALVRTQMQ